MRKYKGRRETILKIVDRLHAKIYRLRTKAENVDWETEIDYRKVVGELEVLERQIKDDITQLKRSDTGVMRDVSAKLSKELNELEMSVEDAKSILKK
jgi:hypothetical protein